MKKSSRPQNYRIKRILELIREGMVSGKLSNCSLFADEFGVTRQTVMADLEFLRVDENAPIEYVSKSHGYILTDVTWELPSVSLSSREVFSFAVARKLLGSFKGTALAGDMEAVLRKISESLEGKVSFGLERVTDKFTVISDDYVVQNPDIWAKVADAVDKTRRISVRYQKFNGETGDYLLEPYQLLSYHGNWYVLARHVEKDRVVTFAVSRIGRAELGDMFRMPAGFDVSRYIENSFGIVSGDKPFKVRVLCSSKIAAYIKERVWQEDQVIKEKKDGSIELSFETAGWKGLVRWILSWQPDMQVLSPKRLRERIDLKIRQGLANQ